MIVQIHRFESTNWATMVFIGWIINMFITGIFAFLTFALPIQKLLPDSYYKVRQPKRLKKWYKILKVDWFRQFLLATIWRNKAQQKGYFDGTKEGLTNLIERADKSEFGHILPFVIINIISIYLITINLYGLAIPTILFNIFGNFYPVLLQRHHRMRIQRIQALKERRLK